MDKKTLLDKYKTRVKEVDFNGEKLYIRPLTVADTNYFLYEDRANQVADLKKRLPNVDIDNLDNDKLDRLLADNPSRTSMAKTVAMRLCDKDGNLLFNKDDPEDLDLINQLDFEIVNLIATYGNNKKN